jgi:predicted DNA-binding transcriptional regulator AlpA
MTKGSAEVISPLYDEKEAARYTTRSVSSLRRGRKDGSGPKFVRLGRSIRYQKSALDAYIDARVIGAVDEVRHG